MAKKSPKLTAKRRNRLKNSTFAIPSKRKYPLDTIGRARNALSRVAQHGTTTEKTKVKRAVKRKYPSIQVTGPGNSKGGKRGKGK